MQNWFHKIAVITLMGVVMMVSQNAMAAMTECANCYRCTSWGATGCRNCVYDKDYCYIDGPVDDGDPCSHIQNIWTNFNELMGGYDANCGTSNSNVAIDACNNDTYCENWVSSIGAGYVTAALCESSSPSAVVRYLEDNTGLTLQFACIFDSIELDYSTQCYTVLALSENCARHIAIADPMTGGEHLYLNCDGDGTVFNDALAYAMCGDDEICFEELSTNWDAWTEALCNSNTAMDLAEYFGFSSVDCENSIGTVLPAYDQCGLCDSGYYYDRNDRVCYQCPGLDGASASTSVVVGMPPITMCYIPSTSFMSDGVGTYQFTYDCPYTE